MSTDYLQRLEAAAKGVELDLEARLRDLKVLRPATGSGDLPMRKTANLHTPVLNLADFVAANGTAPPAVHRSNVGFPWGMGLNDSLGNCGECMAIHATEAFHLDAKTPVPPFVDADFEKLYEEVGGYNPNAPLVNGQNPTDQGTDNEVLVQKWTAEGILCAATGERSKIVASLFVDPRQSVLTRIGIWEFVAVFRAMGLPVTAQGQKAWKLMDPSLRGNAAVASWGYHDIPFLSYDARRIRAITWGQELLLDWDFDLAYAAGGFVVVTEDQLNNEGVSPSGLDWTALNAAIAALPSVPAS